MEKRNRPFLAETLEGYTRLLSSPAAAPGGGSAGALSGALCASLAAMARAISGAGDTGECEALRLRLLSLVDADAAAFEPVAEAWQLPKTDPHRREVLERAYATAADTPMQLLMLCGECAELCLRLSTEVKESVLADVGSAAALCRGAIATAAVNIRANTHYMQDRTAAEELNRRADALLGEYEAITNEVFLLIYGRLGNAHETK